MIISSCIDHKLNTVVELIGKSSLAIKIVLFWVIVLPFMQTHAQILVQDAIVFNYEQDRVITKKTLKASNSNKKFFSNQKKSHQPLSLRIKKYRHLNVKKNLQHFNTDANSNTFFYKSKYQVTIAVLKEHSSSAKMNEGIRLFRPWNKIHQPFLFSFEREQIKIIKQHSIRPPPNKHFLV